MTGWTLGAVARAVGGELVGGEPTTPVAGVSIDSRAVGSGDLFVALAGEHVDGHAFVASAVDAGAAGALVSTAWVPTGARSLPRIRVADTEQALGLLAAAHRAGLAATVVGVTGSAGKTTTKDLLADLLSLSGPTVAAPGSFNNDIGMPLTILSAKAETTALVLEMGARGVGHIERLCRIAAPDVGVVLNVGSAHLGEFGDLSTTARAKGELIAALPGSGLAVLNRDDRRVIEMADRGPAPVLWFGRSADADVRAEDVELIDGRPAFDLVTPSSSQRVRMTMPGEHLVSNALAAAAVAHGLGVPDSDIASALSAATPRSRWRMEIADTASGVTVINDAYNANPDSMTAAVRALAAIAAGRRSWAVLGAMRELGEQHAAAHRDLGRLVAELGIDRLLAVGADAGELLAEAPGEAVADVEEAVVRLQEQLRPGDVVLVKASRSERLEAVAAALLGEAP